VLLLSRVMLCSTMSITDEHWSHWQCAVAQ